MKKEQEATINAEKIKLTNIVILRSSINSDEIFLQNIQNPENTNITLVTEPTFDLSQNISRFRLQINLEGQNSDHTSLGLTAEFMIDFVFIVENLVDFTTITEQGNQIKAILGATLFGICYSTARGIVMERTKGTPFAGTILPVITPFDALLASLKTPEQPQLSAGKSAKKRTSK
jgi:hypothetical protein